MKNLVFLCIGTTKIIGDSIGPKVGDRLKEKGVNAYVYGNTQRQVTAINVDDYAKMIAQRHKDDIVVVIDSALGKLKDIGAIKVTRNGIKPGGAFDKNKERIGDIGILAVVGDADGNRMQELKDRDETFVGHLVDKVVEFVGGLLFKAVSLGAAQG
ncbi:MAG: spore protease YyaC [Clostridia bacterium]|nr:spore protease YyaC [Clostridia bacterium]MDE6210728.1 spore protease YyaC [Clostridia bacterium]MDE6604858.1 spore protease YyaC [Clostridia bacterium]MDE7208616.1 spore protease YyaC [Clostridia bacterium]